MDNLSERNNKVNMHGLHSKIGDWHERHWWDIAIFGLIFLIILAIVGFIRLRQLSPAKQPILFEYNK